MTLTISNTILDEEFRTPLTTPNDENDVSLATFNASAAKVAIDALSLNFFSSPNGFPQHAEKQSFVSSTNQVTNYFLASNSSGAGFPTTGTGVPTTLFVGSNQVFLYGTTNSDVVVGRLGTGTTASASGAVVLTLCVEETKVNGFVTQADMWMSIFAPLVHDGADQLDSDDTLDLSNLVFLGSTFDTTTTVPFENFAGVAPGNNLFNVIFPSAGDSQAVQLLLTGSDGSDLSTVNVSTTGIGAGSQHIDVGATLRIDSVQGMTQANVNQANEVNNSANIVYTDTNDPGTDARVELNGADFEITQLNPGNTNERVTIKLSAFNVAGQDQGQTYLNNVNSNGTPVEIDVADVIVRNGAGTDITASLTITQDGNSVIIAGLDDGATNSHTDGYQVFFTTDGVRFDRFLITNVDGDGTTFDIGNIHVRVVQGGTSTEFAELGSKLIVEDDGPTITASGASVTALTADETTLATDPSGSFAGLFNAPDAGADSPASSVGYTLGVSGTGAVSGLTHTASGDGVFLFLESGVVKGRAGDNATLAAAGTIVFEISVAAGGTVTLNQLAAVVHTDANLHDSTSPAMTASLITLTANVSDAEPDATDDSASATVGIGDRFLFKDDGPVITPQPAGSATPNNLFVQNLPNAAAGTDSSSYTLAPGADGQQSFNIQGIPDITGTFRFAAFDVNGDMIIGNNEIKGTIRINNVDTDLYTLIVNPNGSYTFDMIGSLPSSTLSLDVNDIKAGGPNSNSIIVGALNDSRSIEIAATGGPINESNDNVGVSNGNLDEDEALTFRLLDGMTPLNFEGISIGTKTASGGTYNWEAIAAVGGATLSGSVTVVKNEPIVITPAMLGNVLINSVTIFKDSGSTTKIGLEDIDIFLPPNDVVLNFDVRLTDGDNDFVGQSFTVSIDGNLDNVITNPISASSALAAFDAEPADQFGLRQDMMWLF